MTTKITEQNISNLANAGVDWQSVFTGDGSTGLTAVAGRGYFIDTTSGTVEVTLPASPSAGDVVVLKDYARTWNTNNVTIASHLRDGGTGTSTFNTTGQTVTLVYMDGTQGWSLINEDTSSDLNPALFVTATGGTVTESGDFKIHTFTGDGCFVVSCGGNPGGSDTVDYLVVAGGGSGGTHVGGGGGAGGVRFSATTYCSPSPLKAPAGLPVSATTYPITVGGGGSGACGVPNALVGPNGSNSVFSTITSAGGGFGGSANNASPGPVPGVGGAGGSGGGTGHSNSNANASSNFASGNTPPVSPSQGNPGGAAQHSNPGYAGGGGGGAGAAGTNGAHSPGTTAGPGGNGLQINIDGNNYYWGGGGGGSIAHSGSAAPADAGNGGLGGGGGAGQAQTGTGGVGTGGGSSLNPGSNGGTGPTPDSTGGNGGAGGANTGGGGGAGAESAGDGAAGGKGIVIIRYKFQ